MKISIYHASGIKHFSDYLKHLLIRFFIFYGYPNGVFIKVFPHRRNISKIEPHFSAFRHHSGSIRSGFRKMAKHEIHHTICDLY